MWSDHHIPEKSNDKNCKSTICSLNSVSIWSKSISTRLDPDRVAMKWGLVDEFVKLPDDEADKVLDGGMRIFAEVTGFVPDNCKFDLDFVNSTLSETKSLVFASGCPIVSFIDLSKL